jgi:chemotaxis protein CheX
MHATQTASPQAINPKLIVPFMNSVRTVFSKMIRISATVNRPFFKVHPEPAYDVSGIIGFSGAVIGSVVISFEKICALKLVEAFAGTVLEPNSPDFCDAVGELANMIAGAAKKDLGVSASITCPSVVIGAGHVIARLSDVPCVVIPVSTPVGDFAMEVNIKVASVVNQP